jgi:hypothetical protein
MFYVTKKCVKLKGYQRFKIVTAVLKKIKVLWSCAAVSEVYLTTFRKIVCIRFTI